MGTTREACISEISCWLSSNHLKLNDDKTEFVLIGRKQLVKKIKGDKCITIGNSTIQAAEVAKNIGAYLDSELNMKTHVSYIVRSAYHHMRNISRIRPYISEEVAATLVHAFISSRLDGMNVLLVGLPEYMIRKLQVVQNNAARLVLRKKRRDHATPLLHHLHWLPIKARIKYKVCLLTFKALNDIAPKYLQDLVTRYRPGRELRSANRGLLKIKLAKLKKTGGRSFSVAAPAHWNKLPDTIREISELDSFKNKLKTHLFTESYG